MLLHHNLQSFQLSCSLISMTGHGPDLSLTGPFTPCLATAACCGASGPTSDLLQKDTATAAEESLTQIYLSELMIALPADWSQVWQAAMDEAELPTVLRRALDDSHIPVVAAAAEAMAASICPTEAEMAVLSFAQACPASGGCALAYRIFAS